MSSILAKLNFALFLFIIFIINRANGFCYNTYSKIVFSPGKKNAESSYFGYTTLLRDGEIPTIVVGAPRDDSIYDTAKDVVKPGAIYECQIDLNSKNNACFQKNLDTVGNKRYINLNVHHRKSNMWLGMSIAGTTNNNGTLAACAPRWINQYHRDMYLANGLCYSTTKDQTTSLLPLIDPKKQGFLSSSTQALSSYGQYAYFYAHGQAGISSQMTEDGSELLIGAPGIYVWTGSVIKYEISLSVSGFAKYLKSIIPNPYYTKDLTDASYFGYSVGYGQFLSNKKRMYVAGAPRGADNKGEVYVFDFPQHENMGLNIKAKFEGKTIGEYFGFTIATVDINQDGLTDLIIGAPMYAETFGWDIGRVYVYINQDKGVFIEQDTIIYGSYRDGARFGTSISDIGDINGDGFIDVAIGAPYENHNNGAIYIYLGTENGLNPTYVQRITMDKMKGFGISISKGVDIDKNLCKDIAIGAYESGNVVLLRCHPSVDAIPKIETIPSELSLNDTELTAQICIKFRGYRQYTTELDVNLYVDHEYNRVTFANINDAIFSITGRGQQDICKDIRIIVQPNRIDYSRPIEIKMAYKLKNDPMRDYTFCPNCTVLRPMASHVFAIRVPIAAGCGDDLICRPDLKLKVETLKKLPFIIGTSPSIKLNISLENTGEPAFLTQVQIFSLAEVPILRLPSRCYLQDLILICDFDNPFFSNSQANKFIVVEYSTTLLMNSHEMLTFNITATSGGEELTPDDNKVILNVPLKSIAALEIDSKVAPSQFIYINEETIQNLSITHSFEIINTGPSNLNTVTLQFYLPVTYLDESTKVVYNIMNVHEPKAYIDNQLMICNLVRGEYFNDKTEFHTVDIFNDTIEAEDTTTIKSTTVESVIPQEDEDTILRYISYLPASNDMNVPFTSLNINCTDTEHVSCLIVECEGSLYTIGSNGAEIHFKIDVNQSTIEKLLKNNHLITLSSYAMADSMYNPRGRVYNWARSYMIVNNLPANIPPWLIGLSFVLGILLLALLVYVLHKYGFFKRKTKESMELLLNEDVKDDSDD